MNTGRIKHAIKRRLLERLGPLEPPPVLPDPRAHQPPLPVPDGWTAEGLLDRLLTMGIGNAPPAELEGYLRGDFERFVHTLGLVPADAAGPALEIGANPYFTTLLLSWFRPDLELTLVNYFNGDPFAGVEHVTYDDGGETVHVEMPYLNLNLESTPLPVDDDTFEVVLFCEVLEHLTHDPLLALLELKRVLRPGGVLVLTTPNACRLDTVTALTEGRNLYDPYSKHGPYGRHNREYTRDELVTLLAFCGFETTTCYTADVHPNPPVPAGVAEHLAGAITSSPGRADDLGQYLMTTSVNRGPAEPGRPDWLYRSYPPESMTSSPVHDQERPPLTPETVRSAPIGGRR